MKERVLSFNNNSSLVGIITEPNANQLIERKPAVLFWNAGMLHRVGPHRLYVDMARNLAEMGFLAVRFDLSGKGDSVPRKDRLPEMERTIRDVQDIMDIVSAQKGIEEFVLVGMCSGADDAFPIAVQDERVSGLVMLDGFGYPTLRYYVTRYLIRTFIWQRWKNFMVRKFREFFVREYRKQIKVDEYVRMFPPKLKAEAGLQGLIERGVSLLFVYTSGVVDYYNYKGQFKDMFNLLDMDEKLQVEYFKDMIHTFTRLDDRNRLISCVCDWMHKHF